MAAPFQTEPTQRTPVLPWQEFTDLEALQSLLNDFALLTGITLVVTDTSLRRVTRQTLPENLLCMKIIKGNPEGKRICDECDVHWGGKAAEQENYQIYLCKHGLIDFVSPIMFDGEPVGYLFGGQVRVKEEPGLAPTPEAGQEGLSALDTAVKKGEIVALPRAWYRRHATSLGMDPDEYLAELDRITALPLGSIETSARILHKIAKWISDLASRWASEKRALTSLEQAVNGMAAIAESPDMLRETMDRVAHSALEMLAADVVYVQRQRNSTDDVMAPSVTVWLDAGNAAAAWTLKQDAVQRVLNRREGVYICEATTTDEVFSDQPPVASWAAVPMTAGEELVGLLAVGYRVGRDIEADLSLRREIEVAANHSAILIQNARFLSEAKTRIAMEDEVKTVLGSGDAPKMLLDQLRTIVGYRSASLQLIKGDIRVHLAGAGCDETSANRRLLRPVSRDALVSRIVSRREPLILPDVDADPDWKPEKETESVRSWVGLPVIHDGNVIGLFTLDHERRGFYSDAIKDRLVAFAHQAAPAIWDVRLFNSAQRLIRDIEIVQSVARIISDKLDTHDLLRTITSQIAIHLNCSHCTIFFPERTDGTLYLVPQVAYPESSTTLSRRFGPAEGLAGWVFQNGQSLVLADATQDARFDRPRGCCRQPRSMLVVPVKVGDQTIGVISADQDAHSWFTESDRLLVDALARQVGTAVQRARGLKLLQDVGNSVINLEHADKILSEVLEGAIRLTNTNTGVIYLIGEDGRSIVDTHQAGGFQHPPPRLEDEDGLTRTVMRTRKPLLIPDTGSDARVNPVLCERFKSLVAVPLTIKDRVIGVFFLNDERRHNFTETEVSMVLTLAAQAAIAIENARLLERVQKIHLLIEDVFERLVVYQQKQDQALDSIGNGIVQILGEGVSPTINLYDQSTDQFGVGHVYGPLAGLLNVPPRAEGGTGRYVLKTGKPLYLIDVHSPESCPTIRDESIAAGVQSFAAIPLKRQDRIVGVMFINAQKRLDFSEEIQRVLAVFASQAGIAIEIARLHEAVPLSGALIKAADIGFLASGIAHEFYNNLQNISSLVYTTQMAESEAERNQALRKITEEIVKATRTIDTFRSFRDRGGIVELVNVEALVRDLVEISAMRAKDHYVQLEWNVDDVQAVKTDAGYVQTILLNLLRNAMDAVEAAPPPRRVCIDVSGKGATLEIAVRDSGSGIPQELLGQIFLPFFTTKGSRRMGIGLFWVQRMVESMHGRILVQTSNEWGGATFQVVIPAEQ